jgi:Mg2+/Co2+ transporter CorB
MRDIVNLYAKGDFSIENVLTLIRTPYFVPEGTSLAHQLAHFQTQKTKQISKMDPTKDHNTEN